MTYLENQKLMAVELNRSFDVVEKTWETDIHVKLYIAARTSGFLADISDRNWKTLCVLATYMDAEGNCFPSQDQIARDLKVSRQTANERIQDLLNYRWKGQPIVVATRVRDEKTKRWEKTVYTILPITGLGFGNKRGGGECTSPSFNEKKPMSGNPDMGVKEAMSANPDMAPARLMSGKAMSANADTNKIHSYYSITYGSNKNDDHQQQQNHLANLTVESSSVVVVNANSDNSNKNSLLSESGAERHRAVASDIEPPSRKRPPALAQRPEPPAAEHPACGQASPPRDQVALVVSLFKEKVGVLEGNLEAVARSLLARFSFDAIREKIPVAASQKYIRNLGAFMTLAIKENWEPPVEAVPFKSPSRGYKPFNSRERRDAAVKDKYRDLYITYSDKERKKSKKDKYRELYLTYCPC